MALTHLLTTGRPAAAVVKPAVLAERTALRLALPSKGRMSEDTLQLLKVRPVGVEGGALVLPVLHGRSTS